MLELEEAVTLYLGPEEGWMMLIGSGVSRARLLGMEEGDDSIRSSFTSVWPGGGGAGAELKICWRLETDCCCCRRADGASSNST